ncbi:MAG: hypothetical protein A2350_12330, partial [Candidatus Raymondbacteria bacterium RifOxyB12_full_50_8]
SRFTQVWMLICLASAGLLFSPASAVTGENYVADASNSALSYLKLPVDARSAGVGGAMAALGSDAAAAVVNPALVAADTAIGAHLTASYEKLTLDRNHYFGGLVKPLPFYTSAVGIGYVQYGVDAIERRSEFGMLTGEFADQENTFFLWASGGLTEKLLFGIAGKYHMQRLDESRASGFSGDIGILYHPLERIKVAASCQNVFGSFGWENGYNDELARVFRFGASVRPYKELLSVSSDLEWTPGNFVQGHGGVEVYPHPLFCIRAGAQGPNPVQVMGGVGFRYGMFSVDYAFIYHNSGLGHSHMFSLGLNLNPREWSL